MVQTMRAVISALEERLDAPDRQGAGPGRVPGHPRRRPARRATGCPRSARVAAQLMMLPDDGERGLAAARPVGHDPLRRPARHDRRRPHRARWRPLHAGRCATSPTFALDLSTGVPDGALLPALSPRSAAPDPARDTGSYLDDPVLAELRDVLRARLAVCRRRPRSSSTAPWTRWTSSCARLLRSGRPRRRRGPRLPPAARPARGPAASSVVGVPLDDDRPRRSTALEAARCPSRPAAVFLQPRGQNPTGVSMTPTRARRLAAAAARARHPRRRGRLAAGRHLDAGADQPRARGSRTRCCTSAASASRTDPTCASPRVSGPPALLGARAATPRARAGLDQPAAAAGARRAARDDDVAARGRRGAVRSTPRGARSSSTRLATHGIDVPGTDGLNIWVPVRDEAAAVLRLASQGIGVTPGSPFSVEHLTGPEGHVRVTTGLVRDDHVEVADLIAAAAARGRVDRSAPLTRSIGAARGARVRPPRARRPRCPRSTGRAAPR